MIRLVAALVSVAVLTVVPARAETGAAVVANRSQYYPGDDRIAPVVMPQGRSLEFHNLDFASFGSHHSITSNDLGLFDTGVIHAHESVTLDLSALPKGTYGFHCSVHADVMRGTLIVV